MSWGASRSLRERTPESPEAVRPPAACRPHRVPGLRRPRVPAGVRRGSGVPATAAGRRPGDARPSPLRGVPAPLSSSGSAPVGAGEGRRGRLSPGAEAPRRGGPRASASSEAPGREGVCPSVRALAVLEGSADPAVWPTCHLAPSNPGSSKRTLGTFVGEWLSFFTFCLVFNFLVSFHSSPPFC